MTGPLLPLQLLLLASVNGTPLPGAWFALTLPMTAKNPYRLLFGPASSLGRLTIDREDVQREIKKVRDLFLMDYVDPGIAWTGVLEVHVLNRSDIANVLLAYDTYRVTGVYPADLPEKLTELDAALADHEAGELTVDVKMRGGEGAKVVGVVRPVD